MGSVCSKGTSSKDDYQSTIPWGNPVDKPATQFHVPPRKEEILYDASDGSRRKASENDEARETNSMTIIVERPGKTKLHRRLTLDSGINGRNLISRIISMPRGKGGEQIVAGWPSWLTSVAGEAIQGWLPRKADSFEMLDKIGQGTYSSVYKGRDLETGKTVAMKKVRFANMDPESVRFMAREIIILRRLNHPNVMKLEGLVASKMSSSLFLVFEYMEHDLTGLSLTPGHKFTESQIKCYMQQLLQGLEHCHSRGILHRDIKGSNLLINNNGILKIGDFGLANFFGPDQKQPLTSRVVTLWYRAPELLLGSTDYGIAVDLWSAGCILAELFAGKPIMPGRTEVEQVHKIFKLCGSPSDEYWKKSMSPDATSFKPAQPYRRLIAETFINFPYSGLALVDVLLAIEPEKRGTASSALKSEFFTTAPLPCDPSSLPKYSPSKELDVKLRDEERRRRKAEEAKGQSVRANVRESMAGTTHEFDPDGRKASLISSVAHYNAPGPLTVDVRNKIPGDTLTHCSSMVHPSATGSSWTRKEKGNVQANGNAYGSSRKDDTNSVYVVGKKNRMHYSGPLMPHGGNMEEMLKEHERQIQLAIRRSRAREGKSSENGQQQSKRGRNL